MLVVAGCPDAGDDGIPLGPSPFEGGWVDQVDPAHSLDVLQVDLLGETRGRVSGVESFAPDGPVSPFEGLFVGDQMTVTIARPGGPVEFLGQLLDPDLLLMTSEQGDAYLFVRVTVADRRHEEYAEMVSAAKLDATAA